MLSMYGYSFSKLGATIVVINYETNTLILYTKSAYEILPKDWVVGSYLPLFDLKVSP